eukprot:TRINITY_DN42023_c0_g1_i1.p1 TRINITY_DN42023_c0_g1~~TRINITY_DN42023_c0_g1_i1.p1  ORF type:complete len:210 (-),score=28.96 TRINITY_DN42023_c0_g1_i1:21-605(-)
MTSMTPSPGKLRMSDQCRWPDILSCCDSAKTCFISFWCPCVTAGLNAQKAGTGSCLNVGLPIGVAVGVDIIAAVLVNGDKRLFGDLTSTMNLVGSILAIVAPLAFAALLYTGRGLIARKYGYRHDLYPAFFFQLFCCHCMTLAQEEKAAAKGSAAHSHAGDAVVGKAVLVQVKTAQVLQPAHPTLLNCQVQQKH